MKKKISNLRLFAILSLAVISMFGFGFAMVPLYTLMCKTLGLNGKYLSGTVAAATTVDNSRVITIEFLATKNANLPWDFYPLVKKIEIHPGENKVISYYAKNNATKTMTVQAVPSISPSQAANYLKKTECFCFTQQTFKAGESRDMPVLFHLDPSLPKHINTITLSYTMFDAANVSTASNKPQGRIQ
jgi:cytochrome c oxidase assembly protein subunit 11